MADFSRWVAAAFGAVVLAACSSPRPPAGHWQGAYEDTGLIIVARLEIDSEGHVRVSAPNAIVEEGMSERERADLKARLAGGLSQSWASVAPLQLEFDGHNFHKPGGVAPQLQWDSAAGRMTLIYYSGNRSSVRVPLAPVQSFAKAES